MEGVVAVPQATGTLIDVSGRRVLITGHTGFKGSWLAEWLLQRGAVVAGVALPPEAPGSLFERLDLERRLSHHLCDIRVHGALSAVIRAVSPDLVFHLAAQALVRRSYREPVLTWETNVTGTLNVLESLRALEKPVTAVIVTTDKVYRNREWEYPYRETDELGGHDPYSASKAACEIAVASWRASFGSSRGVTVVSARAGNVLGGGDYSADRIVPDCFRSWERSEPVVVRNPRSTRPWQHVLEPLSGYLALAHHAESSGSGIETCNFGPGPDGSRAVSELVSSLAAMDDGRGWSIIPDGGPHEANSLALSIDRARSRLGWVPALTFEETLRWTNSAYSSPKVALPEIVREQIEEYDRKRRTLACT